MTNKYNVLVNYLGDSESKIVVKKKGDVSISHSRPVYFYNMDSDMINDLRVLRRMLIEIKIGAKPDGAYKIYNLDDYNREKERLNDTRVEYDRRGHEAVSNDEVSNILKSGTSGPIEEPNKATRKRTTKKTTKK